MLLKESSCFEKKIEVRELFSQTLFVFILMSSFTFCYTTIRDHELNIHKLKTVFGVSAIV